MAVGVCFLSLLRDAFKFEVDFYNYFQFGVDFLISSSTHLVQKIVLHTNIVRNIACILRTRILNHYQPGTPMFQRYQRCPWEIEGKPEDEEDGVYCFVLVFDEVFNSDQDAPPRVKFSDKVRSS